VTGTNFGPDPKGIEHMIQGLDFNGIIQSVVEMNRLKKDFVVPQRLLAPVVQDDGNVTVAIPVNNGDTVFANSTDHARSQLLDFTKIPGKFADLLVADGQNKTLEALLVDRIGLEKQADSMRKVRTYKSLDGGPLTLRALLSDSYRPLDYIDMAGAIAPEFQGTGLEIISSKITDKHLYIQAVDKTKYAAVVGSPMANDLIAPGIVIRGSEVGCGSVSVEELMFRKVCNNGAIGSKLLRKAHVGARGLYGDGGDAAGGVEVNFSDTTRALTDAAFWSQVKDVIHSILSTTGFAKRMDALYGLTQVKVPAVNFAVETFADERGLSNAEKESVLMHMIQGGDLTLYGMWNAITRSAEDASNYERAIELERIGGSFITDPYTRLIRPN
jgi:hypothetical protein